MWLASRIQARENQLFVRPEVSSFQLPSGEQRRFPAVCGSVDELAALRFSPKAEQSEPPAASNWRSLSRNPNGQGQGTTYWIGDSTGPLAKLI